MTNPNPSSNPSQPPRPGAAGNRTTLTILLIVLGAALVLCLACILLTSGAAGLAAFLITRSERSPSLSTLPPVATVEAPAPKFTRTPTSTRTATPTITEPPFVPSISPTPSASASPTSTMTPTSTLTPTPPGGASTNRQGLGHSRAELMQFYNRDDAFTFGEPIQAQGFEAVIGTHKTLCIDSNCAAVTLLGPAENVLSVAVSAPTGARSPVQSATSMALLATTAGYFSDTGEAATIVTAMTGDLLQAQRQNKTFEKALDQGEKTFLWRYDASSGVATLAVARKDLGTTTNP